MTTEIDEIRIDTARLAIGMYVCRLDRPWEGTPFPLQGIEVRSQDDLRTLRELCRFVYIDRRRETRGSTRSRLAQGDRSSFRFEPTTTWSTDIRVEDEVPRARETLRTTAALLDQIYADIASGRELSIEQVERVVRPLVASVLRSADALLFLDSMRQHDNYTYGHAVSCGALAAAFGRHMGLSEDTIMSLASGGMLMDVGKTRIPDALLEQTQPLSPDDMAMIRTHVAQGMAIATGGGINDPDVLDILRTHHERYDGSGYPDHLFENGIPMAGRMLAIVDSYDAMCSVRPYRPARSRHEALQEIYRARGKLYQVELVEQFQVCLGVYPTGSRVELSTGELAVVLQQNQVRRLRPTVLVVSDAAKRPLGEYRVFDLLGQTIDGKPIEIVRSFPTDGFEVDAAGVAAIL
ncbi:MAG TPA: HD-GYP domain-containing protein [Rhodanobacteraceae bacterium]